MLYLVAAGKSMAIAGAFLGAGNDANINGSAEKDGTLLIVTADGFDTVRAGQLNDSVDCGSGDDSIAGLGGNDVIIGERGTDTMDGGTGDDRFVYTDIKDSSADANRDVIVTFDGNDRIDLSGIDTDSNLPGDQAFKFIGSNPYTNGEPEIRVTINGGDTLIYVSLGDQTDDMQIAIKGVHTLNAGDFVL